jgi:SOS-response transcriptional repressor LexA
MSKSNRTFSSNDVKSILGQNGPIRLPLFIKKNNDEGLDFYFMGEVSPDLEQVHQTIMPVNQKKKLPVVKIRFKLEDQVSSIMYNYLNESGKNKKRQSEFNAKIIPFKQSVEFEEELRNPIPLFNFYAAAGTFSELQSQNDYTLIEGPKNRSQSEYFACKIIGESMNRVIPNGSICLFKPYSGGARNGKILLIENRDIQDPDFNSAFTIKTYSSEKIVTEENWEHTSIVLRPNSFDSTYQNIIITEENAAEMRIVGEFVEILN